MTQWLNILPIALGELLTICLLLMVAKRKVFTLVPFFGIYLIYSCAALLLRMATVSNYDRFFYVFWCTEFFYLVLSSLCVYKSLTSSFRGLMLIPWFRLVYPVMCAAIVIYSIWKAVKKPPIEGYPITSFIIGIEVAAQYLIAGTFLLFMAAMAWLKRSKVRPHQEIVMGFGIASLGMLLGTLVRSEFGTRYDSFSKFVPVVAYILTLVIWLSAFYTPLPDALPETDDGITADSALRVLEQYKLTLRKAGRWES
jgi:hypothetical protein